MCMDKHLAGPSNRKPTADIVYDAVVNFEIQSVALEEHFLFKLQGLLV
jgi:hypothetical protein